MFMVVEFTDTKTVNIISETWLDDGVALWPNYKSDERINRAIQKHEEPGPDWKQYDVRILSKASDYLRAREKLKSSLNCPTSDLQTDSEEEITRKRKIKPRQLFGNTDSDSDPEVVSKRRRSNLSSAPVPPPVPIPPPHVPPVPPAPIPSPHVPGGPLRQMSARPFPEERLSHSFNPSFRLGRTAAGPIPCTVAQMHILTLLEHIKEQQIQLAAAVNNLAARMGTESPVAEMPQEISFPLATMSEVDEFEDWLKDSRNFQAKENMVSALGAVGGPNAKRLTWNVLSKIFSDLVAKNINWKGVNGKKSFKEMMTRSLLIRAVRKSQTAVPDCEIDSYAIRWFNLASDRGGGRKDRAKADRGPSAQLAEI